MQVWSTFAILQIRASLLHTAPETYWVNSEQYSPSVPLTLIELIIHRNGLANTDDQKILRFQIFAPYQSYITLQSFKVHPQFQTKLEWPARLPHHPHEQQLHARLNMYKNGDGVPNESNNFWLRTNLYIRRCELPASSLNQLAITGRNELQLIIYYLIAARERELTGSVISHPVDGFR